MPGSVNSGSGIYVAGSNNVLMGLTFSNITFCKMNAAVVVGARADRLLVRDCTFRDITQAGAGYGVVWYPDPAFQDANTNFPASAGGANCIVSNNVFTNFFGCEAVRVGGTSNLVVNNRFYNHRSGDIFQFFGAWNTLRGNYVTNAQLVPGGQHPDLFQCYGQDGNTLSSSDPWFETHDNLAENNQFWDCYISFGQMVDTKLYGYQPSSVRNFTERNNLFVRCGSTNGSISSIGIPGFKAINNTYILCGTNANASGDVISLVFHSHPDQTNRVDGWYYRGEATNAVIANCAFIGCGRTTNNGWVEIDNGYGIATNTWNLTLVSNYVVNWNGSSWGFKSSTPYTLIKGVTNDMDTYILPADINPGTDPKLVDWNAGLFQYANQTRPIWGSTLIDAGTNASAWNRTDFEGFPRPFGLGYDVGCFEFDPNLQVHLDFDENFIAAHRLMDSTGYGHDALQFDSTNWISSTVGPVGTAGKWTVVGTMTNDPPRVYNLSQYAGITNLSGIQFITNGTISAWVLWATNAERYDTIFDCGYPPASSTSPSDATNSWVIHYGEPYNMAGSLETNRTAFGPCFIVYGNTVTNNLTHPSLVVHFNQPRDGSNWWHLAVTWTNNTFVAYQNGQPFSTNTLGSPWLRVSGSPVTPWLSVGAMQHNGTPQWGDDNYPNSGFLKGNLGDLRVYNRALSAAEVSNLAFGSGSANAVSGPPRPVPPRMNHIGPAQ